MLTLLLEQERQGVEYRLPWYMQNETDKTLAARGLKAMKCVSCPDVFEVDRDAVLCQCGACRMADQPNPARKLHLASLPQIDVEQMELGEVAS